jgi:anaphase-promoting complex subunit 2
VGPVERTASLSAILTWIDLGVLKEETENTFRLLDKAEEAVARVHMPRSRLGAEICTPCRTV